MRLLLILTAGVFAVLAKRPPHHKPAFSLMRQPLKIIFDYGKICEHNPPDTILHNLTINNEGTKSMINAAVTFTRQINNLTKAIVTIRRCNSPEDEYSCEHFHTWRFGTESCQLIEMKGQIWSSYFEAIIPALKCPFKKGDYMVENATLDVKSIQAVFAAYPIEKYFWRVELEAFDPKLFVCVGFGARFYR